MKFAINIDQKFCVEHGLNLQQGALLDLLMQLSTWAEPVQFDDGVYYSLALEKVVKELPIVFKTSDTVTRHLKVLREKGFVEQQKQGKLQRNFIRLSSFAKEILRFGKNSESYQGSEKIPTTLGKNPEPQKTVNSTENQSLTNQGSEKIPNILLYNNTKDNIYRNFPAYLFLQKHAKEEIDIWEMQNKKSISDYKKFLEYFEIVVESDEIDFDAKKLIARLKKLKYNWRGDLHKAPISDEPILKLKKIG